MSVGDLVKKVFKVKALEVVGFEGTNNPTRWMGRSDGAAPTIGDFEKGDWVTDASATGGGWICTAAGAPGTWIKIGGGAAATGSKWVMEAVILQGTASVSANLLPPGLRVPSTGTFTAHRVNVNVAPVGAGLTVVTKRNGVTIATTTVLAGTTSASTIPTAILLTQGDTLTSDITAIGSTTPGSDVLLTVEATI